MERLSGVSDTKLHDVLLAFAVARHFPQIYSTGKLFDMPSSIAIIHCYRGKVKHYKDFPNSIGYAQIANVLPQFANSLTNNK
jgi:hypothetical protein